MDPQSRSRLCQLPNEVLCLIADYMFTGFALHYFRARLIRKAPNIPDEVLSVLRCCKHLRRALTPSLAKNSTSLVVERHVRDFVLNPRLNQFGAKEIDLSRAFRAGIRELTLISKNMRYPDPSLFPSLELIHVKLLPELSPNLESVRKDQLTDQWLLEVIKQQLNEQPLNPNQFQPPWDYYHYDSPHSVTVFNQRVFQVYKNQQKKAIGAHLIVRQTFRFQARRYDIKNARQEVRVDIDSGAVLAGLDLSPYFSAEGHSSVMV